MTTLGIASMPSARRALLRVCLAATLTLSPGCSSPPARRMGQDAFVFLTSPVQIPLMSLRDAAQFSPDKGVTAAMYPINFPLYLVEHSLYALLHFFDLLFAPYHFYEDSEPIGLYDTTEFPMKTLKSRREVMESGVLMVTFLLGGIALSVFLALTL